MLYHGLNITERDLLIVVDVQNDFVSGVLGSDRAQALIPQIAQFIKDFPGKKIYTMDTHHRNYLETQEGRNLPVIHTIQGTQGWALVDEIKALVMPNDAIIWKNTFGTLELSKFISENVHDNIYVIGFDTIYCVMSNVIIAKAATAETPVHVIASLCACASRETHKMALTVMKTLQVDIVDDDVPD